MKKNHIILALASMAIMASCTGKKPSGNIADNNSTEAADSTASVEAAIDLAAIAGTYEGTLPAADCPGFKTAITINADSTYRMQQDAIDRNDGHDEASGVIQVLDGNVLMLTRPSSGEHTFCKVKDASSIILTDSLGNEPESGMAQMYVLTRKK